MGEIVNLRRVKKSLAHAAATVAARENRVKHGRTKAEKANDARTAVRQEAEVLKHHAELVTAEADQFGVARLQKILAIEQHFARSRIIEPGDGANEGNGQISCGVLGNILCCSCFIVRAFMLL